MNLPSTCNTLIGMMSPRQMRVIPSVWHRLIKFPSKMVLGLFAVINSSPETVTMHKSKTRKKPQSHTTAIALPSKKNKSKTYNFIIKQRNLYKRISSTVSSISCFSIINKICIFCFDGINLNYSKTWTPEGINQSDATMINSYKNKTKTPRLGACEDAPANEKTGCLRRSPIKSEDPVPPKEPQQIKKPGVFDGTPANQKIGGSSKKPKQLKELDASKRTALNSEWENSKESQPNANPKQPTESYEDSNILEACNSN